MNRALIAVLCWVAAVSVAGEAHAHGFQPALLELEEIGDGRVRVLWKTRAPTAEEASGGDLSLSAAPRLPGRCAPVTEPTRTVGTSSLLEHWVVDCGPQSLSGAVIGAVGLRDAEMDVLVRYVDRDGVEASAVLRPDSPEATLPSGAKGAGAIAVDYLVLGVEHILGGFDHLLFVLGLLLLLRSRKALVATVTSFTIGHSITLTGAVLGLVSLSPAVVEAVIALSIALLAVEIVGRRSDSLTVRHPWAVALGFGLLHGFGFAGALTELGVPESQLPVALATFNLGVELGQLAFVAAALLVFAGLRRLSDTSFDRGRLTAAYLMGGIAVFWFLERVEAVWS